MENLYNEWKDNPTGYHSMEYINSWLDGDTFASICRDAENGDEDSEEVLDDIHNRMENVFFHINNKSHQKRIDYELYALKSYLESWV